MKKLKECILNVLELADENENIKSISIPAMASGRRYKFPKDDVADVILTTCI